MNLNEINTEIAGLEELRHQLIHNAEQDEISRIQSLEWTKDCDAKLDIRCPIAAGIPSYRIYVFGKCPTPWKAVTVLGDSPLYEYNVVYGKLFGDDGLWQRFEFRTCSKSALVSFLQKVKFRKLDFSQDDLEVLEAAKKASMLEFAKND